MKPLEAISFFGTQAKLAERLCIAQPTVAGWVKAGWIPWPRQFQIQHASEGALKADAEDPAPKFKRSTEAA
jgi:hypothetical protein